MTLMFKLAPYLGKHRVSGIGALGVGPGLELRARTGSNNARRAVLQSLRDGLDDGAQEGGEKAEDEGRQGLADMVEKLLKARDLGDTAADSLIPRC